jgi:hypothetical protein
MLKAVVAGARAPDSDTASRKDARPQQVISWKVTTVLQCRRPAAAIGQAPAGLAAATDASSTPSRPTVMTMIPPRSCHPCADAQLLRVVDMDRRTSRVPQLICYYLSACG